MTSVIEAMARAAYETVEITGGVINVDAMVRAALAAAEAAGWKLVPVEPAKEQRLAGYELAAVEDLFLQDMGAVYRAMLAASPKP